VKKYHLKEEGVKPTPVPIDIIENPAVFKIK
jgi:hypothetical protein